MLLAGGLTFGNRWILTPGGTPDFRVLLGTAVAAGGLSLFSHVSMELATGIAWIAVVTVLVAPISGHPSVAANLLKISSL